MTKIYKYGYDPSNLGEKINTPKNIETKYGYFCRIINDEYGLDQYFIRKGHGLSLKFQDYSRKELLIYIESGKIIAGSYSLAPLDTLLIPSKGLAKQFNIVADKDSFVYVFFGPPDGKNKVFKKSKTYDRRKKHWAENEIQTIINREYTGKKIFFKKGNSSSLHFHCHKIESYFIHSGKLLLRFKAGQGEDRFFTMNPGQSVKITPGLMHQAGGIEDTIIIEASTHDEDSDSFIVESEFAEMPELKKYIKTR